MISDRHLIQRVLSTDDRHAYRQLVLKHQSRLRSALRRYCKDDHALADDIAQETFIQAYKSLSQFRMEAKFSTWLYKIAYHKFLAVQRKKTETVDQRVIEVQEDHHTPEHNQAIDISWAMKHLSPVQQETVHLCLVDGYSHSEAAESLGIPIGTVKTHILRARIKLKQLLSAFTVENSHE